MSTQITQQETAFSYIVAIVFILTMVAISIMLNDREIILPEIAAMAIAIWVYREAGWVRRPAIIFVAPSATAAIGFAVNQLHLAYLGKVSLTLVLMMLFLRLIQSNFAPSIATGLLPLVTNATEWTFMASVCIFSFILMLGVLVFRFNKGLEKRVNIEYKYMLVFLVLNFAWMGLCIIAGYPQLSVIPPILVVVYESLQKPMYSRKMAIKQCLVLTVSATVGTMLYFTIPWGIVVALLDMLLMLILLHIVGIRVPAVYAFPLLPFVFPKEIAVMLPISALLASVFLFGSVWMYKSYEARQR
ncbi:hypothetical protein [Paenibacillus sp. 481]|uniref:hypothetical protein n=1 Tax=Paenibacillus sp. 481 TaxID=2835869 RepID=UPI001E3EFF16|nr:hypothetical protein [Paenibacillus sp. 481]UHA76156.1 hypothetical protein KIK04_17825 [Paenibacillus sp. 481]